MNQKNQKGLITLTVAIVIVITFALALWIKSLDKKIKDRLAGKRWAAPTEFYSAPERILKGQLLVTKVLEQTLNRLEYKPVIIDKPLLPGEFSKLTLERCRLKIKDLPSEVSACWYWLSKPRKDQIKAEANNGSSIEQLVAVTGEDSVFEVYEGTPLTAAAVIELEPELFAQFYGGQPVLRQITSFRKSPSLF